MEPTLAGRRYLSAAALKFLSTPQTGNLPTGFFQNETYGNRGTNYGWGIGTCVLRTPHEGVAEMLSPGSYGHGGAWGTQAWIDPVNRDKLCRVRFLHTVLSLKFQIRRSSLYWFTAVSKPTIRQPFLEAFDPFAGGFGVVRPQAKAVAASGVDVRFGGHFEFFELEIDQPSKMWGRSL